MKNSKIEWTNHTFSPWWGCQRVSPGCENCYAESLDARFNGADPHWGPKATRKLMSDAHWRKPLAWDMAAAVAGERHRVFCASMADVFEDREQLIEPRRRLWRLIRETPQLDWLLLTKRPENFARMLPWAFQRAPMPAGGAWTIPWRNVWLGVTAEDQRRADERIPTLLSTPAAKRFVSYEPALGPIDFCLPGTCETDWYCHRSHGWVDVGGAKIDWLICGAESGPGARPFNEDWARSARDQCAVTGAAFFYKQKLADGRKVSLPELDGRHWAEVPA